MVHVPVLLKEVLEIFNPQPGGIYIDATVNGGGHALAIAERIGPGGMVLGIDWDCELIERFRIRNPLADRGTRARQESGIKNIKLICANYTDLKEIGEREKIMRKVDGILFDLGFSSYHIEESGRGFSFLKDEPLDMRYNPRENKLTAKEIVNSWPLDALIDIFARYGEERFAKRIAHAIVETRMRNEIISSAELARLIGRSLPGRGGRARIHPATRIFQALRIAVNNELGSLAAALPRALELLATGGKLVIISFHSLEDRIVKTFMRNALAGGLARVADAGPLRPTPAEIKINPRAASARLRWLTKI